MSFTLMIFLICFAGWGGAFYIFRQSNTLNHLFLFLLMSLWAYISFVLWIVSFDPPLWVWLSLGFLPIIVVAYGYRYYEAKQKLAESQNDDKPKHKKQNDR